MWDCCSYWTHGTGVHCDALKMCLLVLFILAKQTEHRCCGDRFNQSIRSLSLFNMLSSTSSGAVSLSWRQFVLVSSSFPAFVSQSKSHFWLIWSLYAKSVHMLAYHRFNTNWTYNWKRDISMLLVCLCWWLYGHCSHHESDHHGDDQHLCDARFVSVFVLEIFDKTHWYDTKLRHVFVVVLSEDVRIV